MCVCRNSSWPWIILDLIRWMLCSYDPRNMGDNRDIGRLPMSLDNKMHSDKIYLKMEIPEFKINTGWAAVGSAAPGGRERSSSSSGPGGRPAWTRMAPAWLAGTQASPRPPSSAAVSWAICGHLGHRDLGSWQSE